MNLPACPAMRISALAIAAVVAMANVSTPAVAGPAEDMLSRLAGEWRGRGTAKIPGRPSAERVTCRIENRWDADAKVLAVSGQCASSQGKSPVAGKLLLAGEAVSGTFLGEFDGATPTRSSGSVSPGELVVSTSFMNKATGNLSQTRQVIRPSAGGFSAEFYLYDNRSKQYEKSGDMRFSGS